MIRVLIVPTGTPSRAEMARWLRPLNNESSIAEAGRQGVLKKKADKLTSREIEVLQLIAEGKANKQTAAVLGIGIKTAEKHREHLMRKLDIHDTAGLTRYAVSAGIIESSVQVTFL